MELNEYFSEDELLAFVERDFPFIDRPLDDELYVVDSNDLVRRIISKNTEEIRSQKLNRDELYNYYDEFGTISSKAVQWFFPSLIRTVLRDLEQHDQLVESLVFYLDNPNFEDPMSAYCFKWLTSNQAVTLCRVLDHLSQETDHVVSLAIENVARFGEM